MPDDGPRAQDGARRVIAVMNQKGGVGKTTTTVNLAAALARMGHAVTVVDLDPQAHATMHLGVEPGAGGASVYDLLVGGGTAAAAARDAGERLRLVPSETDLAAAEIELAAADARHTRLRDALADAPGSFVLIDCPPSLGLLTLNGLVAAGEVLIPMQAHYLALQGMSKLLETVALLRGGLNPSLAVLGVVLCAHDAQSTHAREVVADLEAFFEASRRDPASPCARARVLEPPIRRNIKLAECPSYGRTIFDYAPDANGAADYLALAESVLGVARSADPGVQPAAGPGGDSAEPPVPEVRPQRDARPMAEPST